VNDQQSRQLRIGDAEREAAAHELGEHFAMGRITADEHGERLEQIYAARTAADLAPAFADLPRPRGTDPVAPAAARAPLAWGARPSFPHVPFLLKVLIAVLVVALVVSHLPLLIVALLVYVFAIRRFAHRHPRHPRWR